MKKRTPTKKAYVILTAVAVVLALAATIVWYFMLKAGDTATNTTEPTVMPEQVIDDIESTVDPSDKAAAKKAADVLQKKAEQTDDKSVKSEYLISSSIFLYNAEDYSAARRAAERADEAQPDALSAAAIADTYEAEGNYKRAAEYYGIAAERSEKPADEFSNSAYNDYMLLKREAEAKTS